MEHSGSPRHVIIRQTPNEYRLHCSRHRSDNGLGCNRRPRSTSDRCVPHIRLYDALPRALGDSQVSRRNHRPTTRPHCCRSAGSGLYRRDSSRPTATFYPWNTSAPAPSRAANAAFSVTQRHSYLALIIYLRISPVVLLFNSRFSLRPPARWQGRTPFQLTQRLRPGSSYCLNSSVSSFITEVITRSSALTYLDTSVLTSPSFATRCGGQCLGPPEKDMASMMSCCSRSASAHSMSPNRVVEGLEDIQTVWYSSSFQCG